MAVATKRPTDASTVAKDTADHVLVAWAAQGGIKQVVITRAEGSWLYAGTACVLATLWPVDDRSSCILMERFGLELGLGRPSAGQGVPKAEALRRAQIYLMNLTSRDLEAWEAAHVEHLRRAGTDGLAMSPGVGNRTMIRSERVAYWREHSGASHKVLRDPEARPFRNPFYWAPYVLVGDPG